MNESFGWALRRRFLPFAPIWFVLAVERSVWFLTMLPISAGLMWFQTRTARNGKADEQSETVEERRR